MEELTQLKCEACRVGAPQVTEAEAAEYQKQVPDWVVVERDGMASSALSVPINSRIL